MRYKFNDKAPSGHRQYFIACNIRELELLHGMAVQLTNTIPHTGPTQRLQHVAKEMQKTLAEAIKEADKLGDQGKREHIYPVDDVSIL